MCASPVCLIDWLLMMSGDMNVLYVRMGWVHACMDGDYYLAIGWIASWVDGWQDLHRAQRKCARLFTNDVVIVD